MIFPFPVKKCSCTSLYNHFRSTHSREESAQNINFLPHRHLSCWPTLFDLTYRIGDKIQTFRTPQPMQIRLRSGSLFLATQVMLWTHFLRVLQQMSVYFMIFSAHMSSVGCRLIFIRNHDMSTQTRKHGFSVWGYLLTLFLFQITAPIRRAEGQQNTNEVSGIVNLYTLVIG